MALERTPDPRSHPAPTPIAVAPPRRARRRTRFPPCSNPAAPRRLRRPVLLLLAALGIALTAGPTAAHAAGTWNPETYLANGLTEAMA